MLFNKKSNLSERELFFRSLFLQEEINGDKLVNYIRIFIAFVLVALALIKADVFTQLIVTESLKLTFVFIAIALTYSVFLLILFRKKIYHPIIKYISVTIDMSLLVLSIYVYKLDPYAEYAHIFFLSRFSLISIFIALTFYRYSFRLAIYAGIITMVEYWALIIRGNHFVGLPFSFIGPDGNSYTSGFDSTEIYFKLIYILITAVVIGVLTLRFKNLVRSSIGREHEKNKLLTDNKIMETVNQENKKYLDNINEGLLLIDKNYIIKGQFSKKLIEIFETDNIEGKNIIDFLFPDKERYNDLRGELDQFLGILFNNTIADTDMIMDINPINNIKMAITDKNGEKKEKIISAGYHRIFKDEGVDEIMIIFNDRTHIIEAEQMLEEERNKHEAELEYISAILKTDSSTILYFFNDSMKAIKELEKNLETLHQEEVINHHFREIHSLKGNARNFELKYIANLSHEIEDYLDVIRKNPDKDYSYEISEIRTIIKNIHIQFEEIEALHEHFKRIVDTKIQSPSEPGSGNELDQFLNSLKKMTSDISNELEKKVSLTIKNNLEKLPHLDKLKNPIIHLIRNSIDHGIEDNFERMSLEKKEQGSIVLSLLKAENAYTIEIADDGKGIDFNAIYNKAVEKNVLNKETTYSKKQLLNVLFSPGFTTKKTATEFSGRGVGLDVVKADITKLKGKIRINSVENKGTKFRIVIPYIQ